MLRRSIRAHEDLPALRIRRHELQAQAAALDARVASLDAEAARLRMLGEQAAEPVAESAVARANLRSRLAAAFRLRAEPPDLAIEQRALDRREADARRAGLQVEGVGAALAEIEHELAAIHREAAPVAIERQQVEAAILFGEAMAARVRLIEAMAALAEVHADLVVAARAFDAVAPATGHAPLLGIGRTSLMTLAAGELMNLPDGATAGRIVAPVSERLVERGVLPPGVLGSSMPATVA
jgi:hypothetical protein